MSTEILSAINTRLQSQPVYTTVGGRVYMSQAPDNTDLPLIVLTVVDNQVSRGFVQQASRETRIQDTTIQVDIYTDRKLGSAALGAIELELYAALESVILSSVTNHDRATITCTTRDIRSVEEDALRSLSEYRVIAASFATGV